jgi:hypothetical protein
VRLYHGGVEAYTYGLLSNTEYKIEIDVHNSSVSKAALDTVARIYWIEFGVGGAVAARHLIDERRVDVPVRGNPGEPVTIDTKWRTPTAPGHYCIEVELSHPTDGNAGNNRGWNNTVVVDAAPGETATLAIPVFNAFPTGGYRDARFREQVSQVQLTLDSYHLETPERWTPADVEAAFAPVEAAWNAALDETVVDLAPGTGPRAVNLQVTVPGNATVGGHRVFNVSGTVAGRPIGGVTAVIKVRGT